jgi:hypothetical protein
MEAKELAFKKEALEHGLAHIAIQNKDAMVELMLNIDETWRAKSEKSWFETELDKVDNGWGAIGCRIPIGNTKGEVFLAPVDSITDHVVERWKPETNEWYWKLRDTGVPLELKWTGTKQDWDYYHYGNCFRTNAEAVAARDMVKKALLG